MSTDIVFRANTRTLPQILATLLEARLVPMVISSPGMGKSQIVQQLAAAYNLALIDHRVSTSEPTDFSGMPRIGEHSAHMVPFTDIFPLAHTPVPEGKNGWILFLDEFNSGLKQVQAAAYKPVLDHKVGQYDLHPDARIVLAGNKLTDKAIVTGNLSTAMQSRVVVIELEFVFDYWFEDVIAANKWHPTIVGFLLNNKNYALDFDPDKAGKPFCCPRTWEFMNRAVSVTDGPEEYMRPAYTGMITTGVAVAYMQFAKLYKTIATKDEILANPDKIGIPQDGQLRWALLSSAINWVDGNNFATLARYVNRFSVDMQVFFYRAAVKANPTIRTDPAYGQACVAVSHLLV